MRGGESDNGEGFTGRERRELSEKKAWAGWAFLGWN